MKRLSFRILIFAVVLSVFHLMAADGPKTNAVNRFEPGGDTQEFDCRFVTSGAPEKDAPPIAFRTVCSDAFWGVELEYAAAGNPAEELEIFFRPPAILNTRSYYQIFGGVNKTGAFYFDDYIYGQYTPVFAPLAHWTWNAEKTMRDGKKFYRVRFLFPWRDFLNVLPLNGARDWQFTVIRRYGRVSQSWSGNPHQPDSWGVLRFPENQPAQTRELLRRQVIAVASDAAAHGPLPAEFDSHFFNNRSYLNWRDRVYTELPFLAARIANGELKLNPEEISPEFYRKILQEMTGLLAHREFIDSGRIRPDALDKAGNWSFTPDAKANRYTAQYVFPADFDGTVWATDCAAAPGKGAFKFKFEWNGKTVAEGSAADLPRNFRLADCAKKGDVLRLTAELEKKTRLDAFRYDLAVYHNGLTPGNALDPRVTRPAAAEPVRGADGLPKNDWLSRHRAGVKDIARRRARILFIGDSITDMFDASVWAKIEAKYGESVNLGIGGDRTENALWRVKHGMFAERRPELAVLLIGTNNHADSPEDIADGIRAIVGTIQKDSPETKILILGVLPRGQKSPPDSKCDRINAITSKFADGKTVFYEDFGSLFLNPDRTVRRELLPDLLHPNRLGYLALFDAFVPVLDRILTEKP